MKTSSGHQLEEGGTFVFVIEDGLCTRGGIEGFLSFSFF